MTEKVSLTELQLIIRDSLYFSLPDAYWVMAEISELKENSSGHCYLELIEKNQDEKNIRARVKAIIWSTRYRFLKAYFENVTGEAFREGLKILVKAKIEYHEVYGLSLILTDIDPAFTLGDMAIRRQLIIQRLEQEGVLLMNRELTFPAVPQKIAIISSKNAAGYTDFVNQLKNNNYRYVFYTKLIETTLQGEETETSVINALNQIATEISLFDIVVIIRGGGSQSDLAWFDNYNIAYHITQFPLPVVTGIGHDKDFSVSDMVAHKSLKTPTAVADFLIESVASADNYILEMCSGIIKASGTIIEKNRAIIESARIRLFPLSRILMNDLKDKLSNQIIEIINVGKELFIRAGLIPANQKSRMRSIVSSLFSAKKTSLSLNNKHLQNSVLYVLKTNEARIKNFDGTLQLLKPENILKRGYSITSVNGKIIKGGDEVAKNDIIDTQLCKGTLRSIITDTEV